VFIDTPPKTMSGRGPRMPSRTRRWVIIPARGPACVRRQRGAGDHPDLPVPTASLTRWVVNGAPADAADGVEKAASSPSPRDAAGEIPAHRVWGGQITKPRRSVDGARARGKARANIMPKARAGVRDWTAVGCDRTFGQGDPRPGVRVGPTIAPSRRRKRPYCRTTRAAAEFPLFRAPFLLCANRHCEPIGRARFARNRWLANERYQFTISR